MVKNKEPAKEVKSEDKKDESKVKRNERELNDVGTFIKTYPLWFKERPTIDEDTVLNRYLLDETATELLHGSVVDELNLYDFNQLDWKDIHSLVLRYPQEIASMIFMFSILLENGRVDIEYEDTREDGYFEQLELAFDEDYENEEDAQNA